MDAVCSPRPGGGVGPRCWGCGILQWSANCLECWSLRALERRAHAEVLDLRIRKHLLQVVDRRARDILRQQALQPLLARTCAEHRAKLVAQLSIVRAAVQPRAGSVGPPSGQLAPHALVRPSQNLGGDDRCTVNGSPSLATQA